MSKDKIITEHGYWECANKDLYRFDEALAKELVKLFKGQTVLDLGCGNGAYTNYLLKKKVKAYGCDGNSHTKEISGGTCGVCDLANIGTSAKLNRVDWVLCLEVAEHIPKEYEPFLISNINNLAKKGVVLSWAVPGQGGHGHVNNQSNEAVRERMKPWYDVNSEWEQRLRDASTFPYFKETIMVYETRNYISE